MRKVRSRLTFANVCSFLALVIALGTGGAYAANTIGSSDIINNQVFGVDVRDDSLAGGGLGHVDLKAGSVRSSEVAADSLTGDDVLESSLQQGTTWRLVGASGQPVFGNHPNCRWENYDSVHSSAAFTRDAAGFVHLKGTLDPNDVGTSNGCESAELNRSVFVLPPGYRPQKREQMPVEGRNPDLSVYIDGPQLTGVPAGSVSIDGDISGIDYVSIDGTSFRCAPAGVNGCP